jgi:hypothetical protein
MVRRRVRAGERFRSDEDVELERPEPVPEPPPHMQTEPWGRLADLPEDLRQEVIQRIRDAGNGD